MRNRIWKFAALALAVVMLLAVAGCKPAEKKVLRVATSADYAPYEFYVVEDGQRKVVGFEMEMARYLADKLDMDIEIIDMEFGGIVAAVKAGTADVGIAAMSIDADRLESVDFTDYYYIGKQASLIRAADKDKYTDFDSLDGVKVGVQMGTIHEEMAKDSIPNAQIKAYSTIPDMIMELKAGNVEVLVLDFYVAQGYALQHEDLIDPELPFPEGGEADSYAIAIKKGNSELLGKLNTAISTLKDSDTFAQWVVEANELMLSESAE